MPPRRAAPSGSRAPAPVPPSISAERARAVEAFVAAVLANGAATVRLHAQVAASLGITVGDLTVLELLARRGPLTAGELGAATGLASASVTGLIDRLEDGRWVRRARDPADGRRVRVEARPDGFRRVGDAFRTLGFDLVEIVASYTDAVTVRPSSA